MAALCGSDISVTSLVADVGPELKRAVASAGHLVVSTPGTCARVGGPVSHVPVCSLCYYSAGTHACACFIVETSLRFKSHVPVCSPHNCGNGTRIRAHFIVAERNCDRQSSCPVLQTCPLCTPSLHGVENHPQPPATCAHVMQTIQIHPTPLSTPACKLATQSHAADHPCMTHVLNVCVYTSTHTHTTCRPYG